MPPRTFAKVVIVHLNCRHLGKNMSKCGEDYLLMTRLLLDLRLNVRATHLSSSGLRHQKIEVRWDSGQHAQGPLDGAHRALLACLQLFESLFVQMRHVDKHSFYECLEIIQREFPDFQVQSIVNIPESGGDLPKRHFTAVFEFDHYQLKFTNNSYLPEAVVRLCD